MKSHKNCIVSTRITTQHFFEMRKFAGNAASFENLIIYGESSFVLYNILVKMIACLWWKLENDREAGMMCRWSGIMQSSSHQQEKMAVPLKDTHPLFDFLRNVDVYNIMHWNLIFWSMRDPKQALHAMAGGALWVTKYSKSFCSFLKSIFWKKMIFK